MYSYGKAVSGGNPITEEQARSLEAEHLHALREHYRSKTPFTPSNNVLDQRVAEEMELVQRQLELVQSELKRRGFGGTLAERLEKAEDALDDLADIVGADDKCEGIARAAPELKRRLNRRALDGRPSPCDNR